MNTKEKLERLYEPNEINWIMLSEIELKNFLEEEIWKLFPFIYKKSKIKVQGQKYGDYQLNFSLNIPKILKAKNIECFAENIKLVVKEKLVLKKQELRAKLGLNAELSLFVTIDEVITSAADDENLLKNLEKIYLGIPFKNWIINYFNGKAFAYKIDREDEEQYIFMDSQFVENNQVESIRKELNTSDKRPIFIYGNPKSGKTYTALYLFFEIFCIKKIKVKTLKSVEVFLKYLKQLKINNGREGEPPIYIYMEDPFGGVSYDHESANALLNDFKYESLPDNVNIVFTSRKSPYLEAKTLFSSKREFFNNLKEFQFELSTEKEENSRLYKNSDFEEMLERMAWLLKARWLENFRAYRNNKKLYPYWSELKPENNAPGSLFYAFKLFPNIIAYRGDKKNDIKKIAYCLNNTDNLEAAFTSEHMISLETSKITAIKLFFLLPAMTKIDDIEKLINNIFTPNEQKEIRIYKDIIVKRVKLEKAFQTQSYVYFHSTFAESASKYLREYWKLFFNDIFKYLYDKTKDTEIAPSILKDLLCNFYIFSFGAPESLNAEDSLLYETKLLDYIKNKNLDDYTQAVIVKSIYLLKEINSDTDTVSSSNLDNNIEPLFASIMKSPAPGDQISYVASLIDQMLTLTSEDEYFNPKNQEFLGQFISKFIKVNCEHAEKEPYLRISVFIHGILSKFENFIPTKLNYENLDSIRDEIERNSIYTSLFNLSWFNKFHINRLMELIIIWLDAIFMKIGELHYYIMQNLYLFDYPGEADPNVIEKEKSLIRANVLMNILWEKIREIWDKYRPQFNDDQQKYLEGAMTFIIHWHNKWSLPTGKIEILEWMNGNLSSDWPNQDEKFWEGVLFNINYHREYFYIKSNAWQRESSILIWKMNNPRKGADHLYESGLNLNNREIICDMDDWLKERISSFFTSCLNYFITKDTETASIKEDMESIAFILGMRIPNDPQLAEKFIEIYKNIDKIKGNKKIGFESGIAKLEQFNFKESIQILKLHQ